MFLMVHVDRVLQIVRIMLHEGKVPFESHEWQRGHAEVASGAQEQPQYCADRSRAEEFGQLSGWRVTFFFLRRALRDDPIDDCVGNK